MNASNQSHGELFMSIVEHYKLGDIVGEATSGTNGNADFVGLPGGYTIRFTGMRELKQDCSRLHGIGILPTIPVARTRAAVIVGRDELLERAIETVQK